MNAPLRNSNPASLHAASLACALVLSSLIFLVFPFSRCLSLRGACGAPQPSKKTFVELTPKKNEESAPKSGLKNIRVSNAPLRACRRVSEHRTEGLSRIFLRNPRNLHA